MAAQIVTESFGVLISNLFELCDKEGRLFVLILGLNKQKVIGMRSM